MAEKHHSQNTCASCDNTIPNSADDFCIGCKEIKALKKEVSDLRDVVKKISQYLDRSNQIFPKFDREYGYEEPIKKSYYW
jgi:hypothetical protein